MSPTCPIHYTNAIYYKGLKRKLNLLLNKAARILDAKSTDLTSFHRSLQRFRSTAKIVVTTQAEAAAAQNREKDKIDWTNL